MNELEKMWLSAGEASDLFTRWLMLPRRRDMTARKQRFESNDPNVVMYQDADLGDSYKLEFTPAQREALMRDYRGTGQASIFVSVLENLADAMEALTPDIPAQRNRERSLESAAKALEKLDQELAELDPDALGYLYAHTVDALAKQGVQLSDADNALISMLHAPMRANVEGGELRQYLRRIIRAAVDAARAAAARLPKFDHERWDPRLRTAIALERQCWEHGLPFETGENTYPAACLRLVFDVAQVDGTVTHYLRKAAEHHDSMVPGKSRAD